jgi:hypothetical protein
MRILSVETVLAACCTFGYLLSPAYGATYYVSASGSDLASGTSTGKAWQTIDRVNRATLVPGDRVLFQAQATFIGSLYCDRNDRGTASAPIVISSYGEGTATIAPPAGMPAIFVYNSAGYAVSNLVLKGPGSTAGSKDGLSFYNDLPNNTKLAYINIHNVDVSGFGGHGISIGSWNGKSGYTNVRITYASVHDNALGGINVWGESTMALPGYSHQNVYIGFTKAYDNTGIAGYSRHTGSGIIVSDTDNGTIERSVAYNNGQLSDLNEGPVGIWAWDVNHFLIQYNESFNNRAAGTADGGGFDFDGGTQNSVMQYNYSHDNDGPGYLLCMFPGVRSNTGNVIRYNISQKDARKHSICSVHLYSTIQNASIYNNTIYVSPSPYGVPKAVYVQGNTSGVALRNNIFFSTVNGPLIDVVAGQKSMQWQGNNYWAGGAPIRLGWSGRFYSGLAAWRLGTGQERLGLSDTGMEVDPELAAAGTGSALYDANLLSTVSQYRLSRNSPLVNRGVNLAAFTTLSSGNTDYFGNSLPQDGAFDIGANEVALTNTAAPGDGLIAYWKFDEYSGTTAQDASGNRRTGTLAGNPVWTGGQFGAGLAFNGADSYVSMATAVPVVEASNFTISAWVRPDDLPAGTGAANNAYYGIFMKSGFHAGISYSAQGRFGMSLYLTDNTNVGTETNASYAPGAFYHVVAVVDRAQRCTKIYVNGNLQATRPWPVSQVTRDYGTTTWKAGIAAPNATEWGWAAKAAIDEVRLYNRALSDMEVASLFNGI